MFDHYQTEKLLKRIFHELFGRKDPTELTYQERVFLANHINIMTKNSMGKQQLLDYVTHKWNYEWKMFVDEILSNSLYSVHSVCTEETVFVTGPSGCGIDFTQRYLHNSANELKLKLEHSPIDHRELYDLYEIQKQLETPNFDFEMAFENIRNYKQTHGVRIPVFSLRTWDLHTVNFVNYFKDATVVKLLPIGKQGKRVASELAHAIDQTILPQKRANITSTRTVQGQYKSSHLNQWSTHYHAHDTDLIKNERVVDYTRYISLDSFHPSVELIFDHIITDNRNITEDVRTVLDEIPDLTKETRVQLSQHFGEKFRDSMHAKLTRPNR